MHPLTPFLRAVFRGFAALALIAGALLVIGAEHTDTWFSWTILPPLTAATLGAFYWAAFVLLGDAARAPSWELARPATYPVATIAVLLLASTLIHLDRFHLDSLFGVFWLVAYCLVPPLLAWALYGQLRAVRDAPGEAGSREPHSLPGPLRPALAVEGIALLAMGGLMLIAPDTAADLWPWQLTPLTSRAIGSFVLGIGVAALVAVRDDRIDLFRGAAYAYAALGALELLAALLHGADFGDDGLATGLYLAFFAAILATGLYGSIAARASSRS